MLTLDAINKVYAHNNGHVSQHRFGGPEPRRYDELKGKPKKAKAPHKGEPVQIDDPATGKKEWVLAVGKPKQRPKRPGQWPIMVWDKEQCTFMRTAALFPQL